MSATDVLVPPRRTVHSAANAVEASKVYGEGENAVTAVDKVTVAFEQGRFSAIMGPSGSGKSTLMHCMAGLDPLTSGRAFIVDVELNTPSERQLTRLRRDKVGFIFQSTTWSRVSRRSKTSSCLRCSPVDLRIRPG